MTFRKIRIFGTKHVPEIHILGNKYISYLWAGPILSQVSLNLMGMVGRDEHAIHSIDFGIAADVNHKIR